MTHSQSLKKVERPLFYRIVQDALKDYIIGNALKAGDPLPSENELARQLGISRNSVREAAKALESVGILETRHGSGLFVREFSFDPLLENMSYGLLFDLKQLDELLQVRRVLESGMIGEAIAKISPEQITQLEQLVNQMRLKAERGQTFAEEDRAFHAMLFERLNNQILLKLLDVFWLSFNKATNRADLENTNPMQTYQAHAVVLEAIKARNVEQAQAALDKHYDGVAGRIDMQRFNQESPS